MDKFVKYFVMVLAIVGVIALISVAARTFGRGGIYVNTNGTAVVKQLQALNRYETTDFTIEKVIDAGTSGNTLNQILFGDKILLIAHGEVIAGFDLSSLQNDSVVVNGQTVTLNLPAPQILTTKLDEQKTRVYDRRQGLLSKGDKDLESKARAAAEESIRKAACEENILGEAEKNGRSQLSSLLKALGFTTVIINIPAGSC